MEKSAKKEQMGGILGLIERVGNKIPDITVLFIGAFVIVCVVSAILSQISFDYVHPATGKQITVNNMLSGKELVTLMSKMVTNYANFPPLTMVIVATLGIGIADGSGYINTGLKKLLSVTPKFLITPVVILAGMVSHLGPDTGYVIIIPIAAYMFYATGKHPLSGVAASFAGIAGAFSANYTPSAIDPVIQGFTQSAAQIIDPTYQVNVLCNYFYALGSTFLVIASCWWVTEKVVDPWLWRTYPLPDDLDLGNENNTDITPRENRAFMIATGILILMIIGLFAALYPEDSLLRAPNGEIASFQAPIMQSIVAVIFIFAAAVGLVYGILCGKFRSPKDVTAAMEEITKTLVQMVVFYFFAAQFLYAFGASNIGVLLAVSGAEFLKSLALPPQITILGIIIFVGLLNLIITSASAKWALIAPVFVPMFMLLGYTPEFAQVAYRIGDSCTNVITPMMSYFAMIIVFMKKYDKEAGIGTLVSTMLPYSICFLIGWSILLVLWIVLNLPLGPGVGMFLG